MILIISSEEDACTSLVIDWLLFYKKKFLRISAKDKIDIVHMDVDDFDNTQFVLKGTNYRIADFSHVWYRRSFLILKKTEKVNFSDRILTDTINGQLLDERIVIRDFFLRELKKRSLNSQLDNDLNKLEVLASCRKFGLKTPKTFVTGDKKSLLGFKLKYGELIVKNCTPGMLIKNDEHHLGSGTMLLTDEILEQLPDKFYPMMFQTEINKAFELRVFYLNGDCYSSAIFSQNDEKTKIDFRNYNFERPNRTPPFRLPGSFAKKITGLMEELKLNSGSIDLIVTTEGEFVFLEINPVGQFFQVSYPCNYYLEKRVAEYFN
ncbi:MAG: grasp-with-spasm system ATP-grasp peptide maturase [Flavobacteriales bacterium]|nr:grasp-with-spasm system ATP-grasp peptide maturase [Flavobacteriales bacterium]